MRRFVKIAISLILCFVVASHVNAEPDYTDSEYWRDKCSRYAEEDEAACNAYYEYLMKTQESLQDARKAAEERLAKYNEDIAAYHEQLTQVQEKILVKEEDINELNNKISLLQDQIDMKQTQIDVKESEIHANEEEIEKIRDKLKKRMEVQQSTMRTNQYIDVIMGAESFEQLIRILDGLSSISQYEQKTMSDYYDIIAGLNEKKQEITVAMQELEAAQAELDDSKAQVVEDRDALIAMRYELQKAEEIAEQQRAAAEEEGTTLVANIAEIIEQMSNIVKDGSLAAVKMTNGWTFPVPGSVKSAGTWYYNSGGIHLGCDFAAPIGTTVHAAGNGVILNSANGCPTYGYLGNTCGSNYGGSAGGGNQVYLLCVVNDGLYAVKYCHLQLDSPAARGTVVEAGDVIGAVGTSGNSSGAHCHIEVFYLGSSDQFETYAETWNGDLSFGCGWFYAALNRRCESGVGAPCRIRPETLFGG